MTKIFSEILVSIQESVEQSQNPVVIFDLDDTLIDCRHRKKLLFNDFCQLDHHDHHLDHICKLENIAIDKIQYRVVDTLSQLGIDDQQFIEEAFSYWLNNYFSYPYVIRDQIFAGAHHWVQGFYQQGATIVYLTARDRQVMGKATEDFLSSSPFPFGDDRSRLVLNEANMKDHHAFKCEVLTEIAKIGEVVASFENELANLNHMAETFPEALMIWRDTLYAPNPPAPDPRVQVLPSFALPTE